MSSLAENETPSGPPLQELPNPVSPHQPMPPLPQHQQQFQQQHHPQQQQHQQHQAAFGFPPHPQGEEHATPQYAPYPSPQNPEPQYNPYLRHQQIQQQQQSYPSPVPQSSGDLVLIVGRNLFNQGDGGGGVVCDDDDDDDAAEPKDPTIIELEIEDTRYIPVVDYFFPEGSLRDYVTESEHTELISELNESFENHFGCRKRCGNLLVQSIVVFVGALASFFFLIFFPQAFLVCLGITFLCILIYGIYSFLGQRDKAWFDVTIELAHNSRKKFGSRGVFYRIEREKTGENPNQVIIEIARDAQPIAYPAEE